MALGLLALCLACNGGAAGDPRALVELERMAFVPAARCWIQLDQRALATDEALLVDMFEVTRGEWLRHARNRPLAPAARAFFERWEPGSEDWPASYMTQVEAAAYASERGMRLLRSAEWVVCSLWPGCQRYPWGDIPQESIANTLQLGLLPPHPTPVGTFEGGRTSRGCYDMVGNVWEWCSDLLLAEYPTRTQVSALGGSYLSSERALVPGGTYKGYFAQMLDPAGRYEDVGFRCAAPARQWLRERAAGLRLDPSARSRLRAVGRRWGREAVPLLRELAGSEGAGEPLAVLLEGAGS